MPTHCMEAYPESGDSSPGSRDIDCENLLWDDPPQPSSPTNYRVSFMCSFAGRILPRPHGNHLSYVGGHTKILTVDRATPFAAFVAKLSSLLLSHSAHDFCFKYQLPGEDLDALISVTNAEDLDHMMMEYDRLLLRSSPKPPRLRLFLFPLNPPPPAPAPAPAPDRQWFLDALNSAPPPPPPLKPPPAEEIVLLQPEPAKEQVMFQQRRGEEALSRVFAADYYPQKPQEKAAPPPPVGYWQERQIATPTVGFQAAGGDQQMYLFSTTPVYRPPSPGPGFYMPRVVPEGYRESPVYGVGPTQAQKVAAPYGEGVVREVYYNAPGGVVTSYQTVAASGVPGVVTMAQEGKVLKPPQT